MIVSFASSTSPCQGIRIVRFTRVGLGASHRKGNRFTVNQAFNAAFRSQRLTAIGAFLAISNNLNGLRSNRQSAILQGNCKLFGDILTRSIGNGYGFNLIFTAITHMNDVVLQRLHHSVGFVSARQSLLILDIPIFIRDYQLLSVIYLAEVFRLNGKGRLLRKNCFIGCIRLDVLRSVQCLIRQVILGILQAPTNEIPAFFRYSRRALSIFANFNLFFLDGNSAAFRGHIPQGCFRTFPVRNEDQVARRSLFNGNILCRFINCTFRHVFRCPAGEGVPFAGRFSQREGRRFDSIGSGVIRHHYLCLCVLQTFFVGDGKVRQFQFKPDIRNRFREGNTLAIASRQSVPLAQQIIQGLSLCANRLCLRTRSLLLAGRLHIIIIHILNDILMVCRGRIHKDNRIILAAFQRYFFSNSIGPIPCILTFRCFGFHSIRRSDGTAASIRRRHFRAVFGLVFHRILYRILQGQFGVNCGVLSNRLIEVVEFRIIGVFIPAVKGIPRRHIRNKRFHRSVIHNRFDRILHAFNAVSECYSQFRHFPIRIQNQACRHFAVALIAHGVSRVGIPALEFSIFRHVLLCFGLFKLCRKIHTVLQVIGSQFLAAQTIEGQRILIGRIIEIKFRLVFPQLIPTGISALPGTNTGIIPLVTSNRKIFLVIGQTAIEIKTCGRIFTELFTIRQWIRDRTFRIFYVIMEMPCRTRTFCTYATHVFTRHVILINSLRIIRPTPLIRRMLGICTNIVNPPVTNVSTVLFCQSSDFLVP